jgi:hypothetical protein
MVVGRYCKDIAERAATLETAIDKLRGRVAVDPRADDDMHTLAQCVDDLAGHTLTLSPIVQGRGNYL